MRTPRGAALLLTLFAFQLGGCAASMSPSAVAEPMPAPPSTEMSPSPGMAAVSPQDAPAPPTAPPAPGRPSGINLAPIAGKPPAGGADPADPISSKTPADAAAKDTGSSSSQAAPLLIYVADLGMLAPEGTVAASLDQVIDVAESLGGYLAGRKDTSVEIRIPSRRFREGLGRIEKIGEVTRRSVTAQDVTEEFKDLEVRLLNLKATRQRLQEFLARAGTMQDMLSVEKELERVVAQIDQLEGRARFLSSRAAFSLVTVTVTPKPKPVVAITVAPPPPPPPREVALPIDWLSKLGLETLMNLR